MATDTKPAAQEKPPPSGVRTSLLGMLVMGVITVALDVWYLKEFHGTDALT